MPIITRSYHFCAAHKYWNPDWDKGKNKQEFGKDVFVHGHNYNIELSFIGPVNQETGFVVNLKIIDQVVNPIIDLLDHSQIEVDIVWFKGKQPSSENLSIFIWESIMEQIPKPAKLYNVRIYETPRIFTDYSGPEGEPQ